MPPTIYALRDADIRKLALCKVGANQQRIFLLKSGDKDEGETAVAATAQLIKEPGENWRTAYVPVAVPGEEENPGMFGDPESRDVWDPDEIAKAAHGFMANGAQIVAQHFDTDAAPGVTLVENAVALADFPVGDTIIKEGTWYVGLEFDEAGRELVSKGEIDAVSVEGFAQRVAKVETFSKPGTADVTPGDRAKIKPLAMHYLSKPHPFTACVRDQESHGLTPDHAKRRCAVLLDSFDPARLRHSVAKEDEPTPEDRAAAAEDLAALAGDVEEVKRDGLLRRVAKALGISDDDADPAREGLSPDGGSVSDVELNERVEALEQKVENLPAEIAKSLTEGDDAPLVKIAASVEALAKKVTDAETEDKEPTKDELLAKLDEVATKQAETHDEIEAIVKSIEDLAEGESTQVDEPVAKSNGKREYAERGILFD